MKEKIEKLIAANPAALAVVRELVTLRSMIGDTRLAAAELELELAACHIEEAIDELVAAMDNDQ